MLAHWNNYPRVCIHVAPLGHIILIPSQLVFVLTPESCEEATYTILYGEHFLMKQFDENVYCIFGIKMKIKHHTVGTVQKWM